jgi:hypothetical protein
MIIHQNHSDGEENGSMMVGMSVCLCFASKKPSEQEFFVPAGTDLGVKLLNVAILWRKVLVGENIHETVFVLFISTRPTTAGEGFMNPLWIEVLGK